MKPRSLSRRDMLANCAALGSLVVGSTLSLPQVLAGWEEQERIRKPTSWNELGPFYKGQAPQTTHLRAPGDPGLPLVVSGQVFDTRGNVIEGAKLEIWHADHLGHYDVDGYRYRTSLAAGKSGEYSFESVIPGHYPDRVCQHIHYLINARGCKP